MQIYHVNFTSVCAFPKMHKATFECVQNMAKDPIRRQFRAKQVGMLMRAYRLAYRTMGHAGRLSQIGLLELMGQVDERYSELHGHSTVARWEAGATRPTRERIEVFGRALNLSPEEIAGLMRLAGFELGNADATVGRQGLQEPDGTVSNQSARAFEGDDQQEAVDGSREQSWGRYQGVVQVCPLPFLAACIMHRSRWRRADVA